MTHTQTSQPPEALMGPSELSHYLGGIPVPTIYRWRYRNEGPRGFRVGRHLRYRKADIDAWLETQADRRP